MAFAVFSNTCPKNDTKRQAIEKSFKSRGIAIKFCRTGETFCLERWFSDSVGTSMVLRPLDEHSFQFPLFTLYWSLGETIFHFSICNGPSANTFFNFQFVLAPRQPLFQFSFFWFLRWTLARYSLIKMAYIYIYSLIKLATQQSPRRGEIWVTPYVVRWLSVAMECVPTGTRHENSMKAPS